MTMNDDLDLSRYQVRTDLALEAFEMALDQISREEKSKKLNIKRLRESSLKKK